MSFGIEFSRSETQQLEEPMDTSDDLVKPSGMFWDIPGLRQLVVDYLDPKTAETAARFFFLKEAFQIFQRSLETRTYAERDCIDFIRARFGTEDVKPSLMYVIKNYLPQLEVLNFTTFPVPAAIVLQLSRDPHTAIILMKSCAFLPAIHGGNVRTILADKILNTLGNTGAIVKEEIPDLKKALIPSKKRKAENSLLNLIEKKSCTSS